MLCNLVGEWIPQRTTTKSQCNESSGLKSSMLLDTRKPVRIETPIYSTVMTFLGVKKWLSLKVTNSIGVSEVSAWRPGLGTFPVFQADPSTFISLAVLLGNDIANKMAIAVPVNHPSFVGYLPVSSGHGCQWRGRHEEENGQQRDLHPVSQHIKTVWHDI